MKILEAPVWDEGLGEYQTRRIAVVGCLAHVGDGQAEPQFRLYLGQIAKDGRVLPMGTDVIPNQYLQGFTDQLERLYSVLIAEGDRTWAGTNINFGKAQIVELEGR